MIYLRPLIFSIMKYRDLTILMSATSSNTMPGVYRSFKSIKERNIRVVGMDMTSDPSAKFIVDAFYQVPPVSDEHYIDAVLDICMNESVDIYFPSISAEVSKVSKRRKSFEQIGTIVSISDEESVAIANNKLHTYQALEKAGIPVPKYYGVHTIDEFIEGCKHMGYPEKPVCIKIVNGSGSRGVRIIDAKKSRYDIFAYEKPNSFYTSYEDMLAILKSAPKLDELMLLEVMHGPEFTVDMLADKGTVLYEVGRENVVSLMSIAQESVIKYDEHAYKVAKDVVKLLKMDGNVGIDFMRNDKEEAVLMDINPRTTATLSLLAAGGLNLRYLRIKQLLGEPLPQCEPIYGTRLKRRYGEIYTDPDGKQIIM